MNSNRLLHSLGFLGCGSLTTFVGMKLLNHSQYSQKAAGDRRDCGEWNSDWDGRQHEGRAVAARHIVLVRHGEYRATKYGKNLTDLGRRQAKRTGQRLHELGIGWDQVVASTLTRAQETAKGILKQIDFDPDEMEHCDLLIEGTPYPSIPPNKKKSEIKAYSKDGPRIEAAFHRYIYRASPDQKRDSYMLIVGHANVIRYFVCRALQLPPEAWRRFNLNHGSITWLIVGPSGHVAMQFMGNSGFMAANELSFKNK